MSQGLFQNNIHLFCVYKLHSRSKNVWLAHKASKVKLKCTMARLISSTWNGIISHECRCEQLRWYIVNTKVTTNIARQSDSEKWKENIKQDKYK